MKPELSGKLKDCGIHMLDAPEDILPGVLRYLGLNPDSKNEADLRKAADALAASAATSASSTRRNTSTRWPAARSAWRSAIPAISCRRGGGPRKPATARDHLHHAEAKGR
jgi:hypothetical protein